MKFYSSETMRQHAQDLTKELEVKQIPKALRYFMINNDKGNTSLPMHDMASKQGRGWSSTGLLDIHDLAQECHCALIRAYNRVDWSIINSSSNPKASLWAYLKKSITLDVRKAINSFKDGMRIPLNYIWEAKIDKHAFELDNFFSVPVDGWWLFVNDEILNIADDSKMSTWETEELYRALQDVMRVKLTDTERLILEMSFGIDEPHEKPRSAKKIGEFFNLKESNIRKIKQRALIKMKTPEIEYLLEDFLLN